MQSLVQEFPQRVFGIFEEQTVVAERRHGNGDLSQVVEILQHWTLKRNRETQVTRAREGWEGGSRGEASSVEARGLGSVCASPQPSPTSPKPRHPSPSPPPASPFTPFLVTCPSVPGTALLSSVESAPSCLQSGGPAQGRKWQLHSPADPNLHTLLPSPTR